MQKIFYAKNIFKGPAASVSRAGKARIYYAKKYIMQKIYSKDRQLQ
jgi:hypothetical protein